MPLNLVQRLLVCLNDLDVAIVAGIGVAPDEFRRSLGRLPISGRTAAKNATCVPADRAYSRVGASRRPKMAHYRSPGEVHPPSPLASGEAATHPASDRTQ